MNRDETQQTTIRRKKQKTEKQIEQVLAQSDLCRWEPRANWVEREGILFGRGFEEKHVECQRLFIGELMALLALLNRYHSSRVVSLGVQFWRVLRIVWFDQNNDDRYYHSKGSKLPLFPDRRNNVGPVIEIMRSLSGGVGYVHFGPNFYSDDILPPRKRRRRWENSSRDPSAKVRSQPGTNRRHSPYTPYSSNPKMTFIRKAVEQNQIDIVHLLVFSPPSSSATGFNSDRFNWIISRDFSPEIRFVQTQWGVVTILDLAAKSGHVELVQLMLKHLPRILGGLSRNRYTFENFQFSKRFNHIARNCPRRPNREQCLQLLLDQSSVASECVRHRDSFDSALKFIFYDCGHQPEFYERILDLSTHFLILPNGLPPGYLEGCSTTQWSSFSDEERRRLYLTSLLNTARYGGRFACFVDLLRVHRTGRGEEDRVDPKYFSKIITLLTVWLRHLYLCEENLRPFSYHGKEKDDFLSLAIATGSVPFVKSILDVVEKHLNDCHSFYKNRRNQPKELVWNLVVGRTPSSLAKSKEMTQLLVEREFLEGVDCGRKRVN